MKKLLILGIGVIIMSSCARSCQSINKNFQVGDRYYHITQFSGGDTVAVYRFKGILNDSENSDGYYFSKGDTLIEISGEFCIKSID